MFTNDELNREFIFVTSRSRVIVSPPTSEDIHNMREWCSKIRQIESKTRKWLFSFIFFGPMLVSSIFVSWSTLVLIMLLGITAYTAVVFLIPYGIRFFMKVSFKIDEAEMVNPMNETLFLKLNTPLISFAKHVDAIKYCKNIEKLKRDTTVFDKYIVFMLNVSESTDGAVLKSEIQA